MNSATKEFALNLPDDISAFPGFPDASELSTDSDSEDSFKVMFEGYTQFLSFGVPYFTVEARKLEHH